MVVRNAREFFVSDVSCYGDSISRRYWLGRPGDLGVLRGVVRGFSEEARTRSFASLALARFAFISCDYGLSSNGEIASIRGYT